MRGKPHLLIFVALALLWSAAATFASIRAHASGFVAPLCTVLPVAAFAWTRRDRELGEVFGPAAAVSYAAFLGLALVRVPQLTFAPLDPLWSWHHGPLVLTGSVAGQWPIVLVGGLIYALALTVLIALPVSQITPRPKTDPRAQDRFWALVAERNARAAAGPTPPPDESRNPAP